MRDLRRLPVKSCQFWCSIHLRGNSSPSPRFPGQFPGPHSWPAFLAHIPGPHCWTGFNLYNPHQESNLFIWAWQFVCVSRYYILFLQSPCPFVSMYVWMSAGLSQSISKGLDKGFMYPVVQLVRVADIYLRGLFRLKFLKDMLSLQKKNDVLEESLSPK